MPVAGNLIKEIIVILTTAILKMKDLGIKTSCFRQCADNGRVVLTQKKLCSI